MTRLLKQKAIANHLYELQHGWYSIIRTNKPERGYLFNTSARLFTCSMINTRLFCKQQHTIKKKYGVQSIRSTMSIT